MSGPEWLLPVAPDSPPWVPVPVDSPPCPYCECCTRALCTRAKAGVHDSSCLLEVEPAPDLMDVTACPCAPHAALGRLGEQLLALRDDTRG